MPRKYEMKWQGAPYYRWRRMFRGVRYVVTCEQLNAPLSTEEGSYKLANEWWRRKFAELSKPSPEVELLNRYKVADLKEAIEKGQAARRLLEAMPFGQTVDAEQVESIIGIGPIEKEERRLDLLAQVVGKVGGELVQTEFTLEKQAERFLATERNRGEAPGAYGDLAYYVQKLQAECPVLEKSTDVRKINEATVTDFYAWLRTTDQAPIVQRKLWSYFRRLAVQRGFPDSR